MAYKNMRDYRTWYREQLAITGERNDDNFVGTVIDLPKQRRYGFFNLVHGNKEDIESLLNGNINMADDSQGIFEFIQNAADCDSTHFYLFFNDHYLLALNNGSAFHSGGVSAILNIGQSSADKQAPGKIGRYGIGFKLVHRLVGADTGIPELMKDYAGPVVFSWSRPADFQSFLAGEDLFPSAFEPTEAQAGTGDPWLFKILLTCFPAMPGETIRGLDYQTRVGFPLEELAECRQYLSECAPSLDQKALDQGSLFFLRLGDGKSARLEEDQTTLRSGMRSALHFLGGLKHVTVQKEAVQRLEELTLEQFVVKKGDARLAAVPLEGARDLRSDLEVTFGFAPVDQAETLLRKEASFYKYFPVAAEDAPYTFVLHSNLLGIKSTRTEFQSNNTNNALLPLAAELLHEQLASYTGTDADRARRIWGGLLLSDEPEGSKHAWQKLVFYTPLLAGLPQAVPTTDGRFKPASEVKINRTKLLVTPAELGISGQNWFYWPDKHPLAADAVSKLGLVKWGIAELITHCQTDAFNAWVHELPTDAYQQVIEELEKVSAKQWVADAKQLFVRLMELRIFHFSDEKYYSLNTISSNAELLLLPESQGTPQAVLQKIGFSTCLISDQLEASELGKAISQTIAYLLKNGELYNRVSDQLAKAGDGVLLPVEKWQLLNWLENSGVTAPTLRKLVLFCNVPGTPKPLGELVSTEVALPSLMDWAEVSKEEWNDCLKPYVLETPDLYAALIQSLWETWKKRLKVTQIDQFCQSTVEWYKEADNPGHLPGGKAALTPTGFLPAGNIFYHPALSECSDYASLSKAILAVYGLHLPVEEMLPWLDVEPFKLTADTLALSANASIVLSRPELIALHELARAMKTQLTSLFTVQAKGESYLLTPRQEQHLPYPVASEDETLRAIVQAHCPDLHLLPQDALGRVLGKEDAVLEGAKLLMAVVDEMPREVRKTEAVLTLMSTSKHVSVVQHWLHLLPEVYLNLEPEYASDHPDRLLLRLAADTLKPGDYGKFRRKLLLDVPEFGRIELDGAAEADEIKLDTHAGSAITLRRSELLPGADKRSEAVNILADRLGADAKLRLLMGLGEEPDHARLQKQVLEVLQPMSLAIQNVSQLAYLLLTSEQATTLGTACVLADLQIRDIDNQPRPLDGLWYTNFYGFIERQHILHPNFSELSRLLKITREREYAIADTAFILLSQPQLTSQGLHAPGICVNSEEPSQQALLTYLYEQWEKREQKTSKFDWPSDWATLADLPASDCLGFTPAATVLSPDLACMAETCPAWLLGWVDMNSAELKTRFLATLGVAVPGSPLLRLRQAFREPPASRAARTLLGGSLSETSQAQQRSLRMSLVWLHENQLQVSTSWHQQLLSEVFAQLDIINHDFELLAYLTAASDSASCYEIHCNSDNYLLLDTSARHHLQKHGVGIDQLLLLASSEKRSVLDLSLYPTDWQMLTAERIEVECSIDLSTLQAEATEAILLLDWAASASSQIYLLPGLLPQERSLLNQPLSSWRDGNLFVNEAGKCIYVSESALSDLPDLLADQFPAVFSTQQLDELRRALSALTIAQQSNELTAIREELASELEQSRMQQAAHVKLAAENEGLRRELMELRAARGIVSSQDEFAGRDDVSRRSSIKGSNAAANAAREAVTAAREQLSRHPDYDCTDWNVSYSIVRGVLYKGEALTLVVKSAKWGDLYLTPFDWLALAKEQPSALLVLTSNGSFQITPFKAIQEDERNRRFSVSFDLYDHTPELLTALAGFYRELYGETGFVQSNFLFYQPGMAYTDTLEVPLRGFFGATSNPDAGPVSAQSASVL